MEKDFSHWSSLKQKLDSKQNTPTFKQREIWWVHIGLNIGDEENGKNGHFHRPVLVVKKFNNRIFLGVPLTTKIKDNPYYHKIIFGEKEQCAMLSQFRVLDSKRLDRKIGQLLRSEYETVREELAKLTLR